MVLPAVTATPISAIPPGSGGGVAKKIPGRGTYENLAVAREKYSAGETGQALKERYAARLGGAASPVQGPSNALVAQAGLPSGLNRALPQTTADVLAVRLQRQNFMFRTGS